MSSPKFHLPLTCIYAPCHFALPLGCLLKILSLQPTVRLQIALNKQNQLQHLSQFNNTSIVLWEEGNGTNVGKGDKSTFISTYQQEFANLWQQGSFQDISHVRQGKLPSPNVMSKQITEAVKNSTTNSFTYRIINTIPIKIKPGRVWGVIPFLWDACVLLFYGIVFKVIAVTVSMSSLYVKTVFKCLCDEGTVTVLIRYIDALSNKYDEIINSNNKTKQNQTEYRTTKTTKKRKEWIKRKEIWFKRLM